MHFFVKNQMAAAAQIISALMYYAIGFCIYFCANTMMFLLL
jgi:uncharacterized membrane protein YraQ (UPF0718 family)